MSQPNSKPVTGPGLPSERTVAVPALVADADTAQTGRFSALRHGPRRRLNSQRLQWPDSGFRLFRVY